MAEYNDDIIAKAGVDLSGATSVTAPQAAAGPYMLEVFTETIDFSDLGTGATWVKSLTAFPTNVTIVSVALEINTAFAGEADVTVIAGDTGDDNELFTAFSLDGVAAGWAGVVAGASALPRFEADFDGDGADLSFAATELDDVTAGNLTLHINYFTNRLAT